MNAGKHNSFGIPLKSFLILDFLILLLSFVGTAQFAMEAYQLMSFAGFAAIFALSFSLVYCGLFLIVFALLGVAWWRQTVIFATVAFFLQILIWIPSLFFDVLDGPFLRSWHDGIKMAQILMGIVGLSGLLFRYVHRRNKTKQL